MSKNLNGTLRLVVFLIVIIAAVGGIFLRYGEVQANTEGVRVNKKDIKEQTVLIKLVLRRQRFMLQRDGVKESDIPE